MDAGHDNLGEDSILRAPEGFKVLEAANTIAMCCAIEGGNDLAGLLPTPTATGWDMIFVSPNLAPFDNQWQLWSGPGNNYAVVIRGTTAQPTSLLEDLMAVMIPARGSFSTNSGILPYCFALDPMACVHLGFAIGALRLLFLADVGILSALEAMVPKGARLIVTGHSQGAAIATLIRAFFAYSPFMTWAGMADFYFEGPTYAWAQPKPGNDRFAWAVERIPEVYRIESTQDFVHQLPLTLQGLISLNWPNPLSVIPAELGIDIVTGAVSHLAAALQKVHLALHAPALAHLTSMPLDPLVQKTLIPSAGGGIQISATLNFAPAGIPVTLIAEFGANPNNPKDCAWQHHAAMYSALLLGIVPEAPVGATSGPGR